MAVYAYPKKNERWYEMKILLLTPPTCFEVYYEAGIRQRDEVCTPPLGLGYIASVLEQNGYDVNLINIIRRINSTAISVTITQIFPGTALYEITKQKGFINDDYWLNLSLTAPVYILEKDIQELKKYKKEIESFFVRNKLYAGIKEMDIRKIAVYGRYRKSIFKKSAQNFMRGLCR